MNHLRFNAISCDKHYQLMRLFLRCVQIFQTVLQRLNTQCSSVSAYNSQIICCHKRNKQWKLKRAIYFYAEIMASKIISRWHWKIWHLYLVLHHTMLHMHGMCSDNSITMSIHRSVPHGKTLEPIVRLISIKQQSTWKFAIYQYAPQKQKEKLNSVINNAFHIVLIKQKKFILHSV